MAVGPAVTVLVIAMEAGGGASVQPGSVVAEPAAVKSARLFNPKLVNVPGAAQVRLASVVPAATANGMATV